MVRERGKIVFSGISIGKIKFYDNDNCIIKKRKVENSDYEIDRFNHAKEVAIRELSDLYEKALVDVGEDVAALFEVHQMLIEDDDYNEAIINMIESQCCNAEHAVNISGQNFAEAFRNMDDEYFKARSADILDISNRIINALTGKNNEKILDEEGNILVARDLAPSETVQMDKNKLLALVTKDGSENSHTAILARTIGLPALIGINIDKEWDGKIGIVDGNKGEIIIEPTYEVLEEYENLQKEEKRQKELINKLKGEENVTKSGKKVDIYANIGSPSDLGLVLDNDAGGIGLFRSEFLYLGASDFPSEEEQFRAYRQILETMAKKKVVVRTMDIGADKKVDYFNLPEEENPALGYRAIRICLTDVDMFKTQLRALFRASVSGNLSIMYPMITSLEEVLEIKKISGEVKEELKKEGYKINENVEEGIMIETPAAALISDILAPHVDFFSIGTNDLTQYTCAIDRMNPKLEKFSNTHHEAVLKLIKMTVENSHKAGIWTGICGELGSDLDLTEYFLNIGVDELSVSPSMVLKVRNKVRSLD